MTAASGSASLKASSGGGVKESRTASVLVSERLKLSTAKAATRANKRPAPTTQASFALANHREIPVEPEVATSAVTVAIVAVWPELIALPERLSIANARSRAE